MLDIPGAVEAQWPDEGVAAHYGDPMREQRAMTEGQVLVDRSNRGVVRIAGQDRLTWLHSLTSQHLERLAPGESAQALILSPQGHLEHHLTLTDDGSAVWAHVEPGTAPALVAYLDSMRFMMRVEVTDVTSEYAVQTLAGPVPAEGGFVVRTERADSPGLPLLEARRLAKAITRGPFGIDLIVPRSAVGQLAATAPVAGMWAFEAVRIAGRVARPGLDTDHKTLPHEVGLIETAVHLNKGCYRGQETVARIHNLGHPPRRLVFLHLDGSVDRLPEHGSAITLRDGIVPPGSPPEEPPLLAGDDPRTPGEEKLRVGFTGSAARHFELGPIGLGLIKRSVPVGAALVADGIPAAQEVIVPPDAGANVRVTLRRDFVPPPAAGRKLL
jgi:tRNA-modifying protein YgfZ